MKIYLVIFAACIACTVALHVPSSTIGDDSKLEEIQEKKEWNQQRNEAERRKQIEAERRRQQEQQRKQQEQRRKEEEKRRKEEEERRKKERERQEAERRKQEAERRKQDEERRKQDEERRKQDEDRRKQDEERRKQIESERKKQDEERRKQEEKRRKEEEKRRKEAEERQRKERERVEAERRKQEKERRKQEEERRKQIEKERRKQEEERRKQEEERRKQEEERRKQIEKERARQWENQYQNLKKNNEGNEEFWKMKKDKKENNYPTELKEKYEKGEEIKPEEEDKFENEFGRYKSRNDTKVIDLLAAINRGNDVENLEEGDMLKHAAPTSIRNLQRNRDYCKKKENKKKGICLNAKELSRIDTDEEAWERKKRDGVRDRVYLWLDRIVPYEIDSVLESSRDIIEISLQKIADVSCVKFVKHTNNDKNWIKFVKRTGCWSAVGRQFWVQGSQEISLGNNCMYNGIIMHEVMHALGFFHEQSRPDRDEYVEIFWENIQPSQKHNFIKYKNDAADLLEAPYDYSSIMHYGKYSFALDAKIPTVQSIKNKAEPLGQRTDLSPTDVFQINELYNCKNSGSGWSDWSSFGPCDDNCDKVRNRFCMDSKDRTSCSNPTSTSMLHWGIDEQKIKCSDVECNAPVDGHWNRWGSWGECSVTCDKGVHSRTRECTDPQPKNGGIACIGMVNETRECIKKSCNSGPYDCSFDIDEESTCSWSQDTTDDFDWTRITGGTPSSSTGPSADHSSGTGYYMYMESSAPSQTGWKTRLLSATMSSSSKCMKFAYNMYGLSTGSLRVYVRDLVSGEEKNVFEKSGDQLKEWHVAEFSISNTNNYKVIIESERSTSFQGDIAIDDIEIKEHLCGSPNNTSSETELKIPTVSTVGCYRDVGYIDGKRPFPEFKDFRPEIVWDDSYMSSLNETVLKCGAFARQHSYEYFGVEFYGECWTGPTSQINYGRDGEATDCFPQPALNLGTYLVGGEYTIMVYRWTNV